MNSVLGLSQVAKNLAHAIIEFPDVNWIDATSQSQLIKSCRFYPPSCVLGQVAFSYLTVEDAILPP